MVENVLAVILGLLGSGGVFAWILKQAELRARNAESAFIGHMQRQIEQSASKDQAHIEALGAITQTQREIRDEIRQTRNSLVCHAPKPTARTGRRTT